MTLIGRGASALLVLAVAAMILIASVFPDLAHIGDVHVVDWVGLAIYVGAPVAWFSAIFHWARHFPREGRRALWGLVVVVGFVPGAVAYWFWGVGSISALPSTRAEAADQP